MSRKNIAATRAELLASLDRLAELGERLDGPYRLGAAYIRQQINIGAAIRLKRRDEAILELRFRWHADQANNAAAKEMQRQLNRYAATAWRVRRTLDEPTPADFGTYREQLWRVLKEADGQVLAARSIREIIDEAPKQQRYLGAGGRPSPIGAISSFSSPTLPPTLDPRAQNPESPLNTRPSFDDFVPIVRELPGFKSAEEKAHARIVAERQAHLDAIARLDAEAIKDYPRQENLTAKTLAAREEARRALKFAEIKHQKTYADVAAERFASGHARRMHEVALIDGEWPELTVFRDLCYAEIERAEKALESRESTRSNARTGKTERLTISNWNAVNGRLKAIRLSMRDEAPDLRLLADPRQLPAALQKIIASWPPIADVPAEPDRA